MIKVITPIGAVVEVDESVYEANSHILRKYEDGEEVESAVITTTQEAPQITPENGDTEIIEEVKTKATKAPKTK